MINQSILKLKIVYFNTGSSFISKEGEKVLKSVFNYLSNKKDINIEIQGYTDNRGSLEFNYDLSLKRAKSAKKFLVSLGLNPNRVSIKGYGETLPLIDCGNNCSPEQNSKNRRVEFLGY